MADVEFNPNRVTRIYVGGDRVCRCGCAGEYIERGSPKFEATLVKFEKKLAKYEMQADDYGGNYLNVTTVKPRKEVHRGRETGYYTQGRCMTAYFD